MYRSQFMIVRSGGPFQFWSPEHNPNTTWWMSKNHYSTWFQFFIYLTFWNFFVFCLEHYSKGIDMNLKMSIDGDMEKFKYKELYFYMVHLKIISFFIIFLYRVLPFSCPEHNLKLYKNREAMTSKSAVSKICCVIFFLIDKSDFVLRLFPF